MLQVHTSKKHQNTKLFHRLQDIITFQHQTNEVGQIENTDMYAKTVNVQTVSSKEMLVDS